MKVDFSANLRCLFVVNDHLDSQFKVPYILQMETFKTYVRIKKILENFFPAASSGQSNITNELLFGKFPIQSHAKT